MSQPQYDLAYLSDPRVFAVGRLAAFSDHDTYLNAAEASAESTSLKRSLNGMWKFHYAKRVEERPQGFFASDYDCSAWDDIRVPGHIQMTYGKPQYTNTAYPWDGHEGIEAPQIPTAFNPVGSYARAFEVPQAWSGMRVVLTFHGVETAFYCWVNGRFIGYSEDSFTPAHFDITEALVPGVNRLAVEVYRFSTASYLEDQDFWRFSGIFRDVELCAWPVAHVHDVFARAGLDDAYVNGELEVDVALDLPQTPVTLMTELLDAQGETVVHQLSPAEASMTVSAHVERPSQWSAETPALYTLRLTLVNNAGAPLEVAQTRVGFRRFEMKDGLMCLNGKRIEFNGADRHEFCMEAGRSIAPEHMLEDLRTMKRHNINAVRTSHYPNQTLWYKLCDEYGVYLIDETNLETHGTWAYDNRATALPGDYEEWLPPVLDRARSMLERDKNHPSVLIWSCGNESFGGRNLYEMSQFFRQRDKTRLVHYEGVANDRRYEQTSDMESQMYTKAAKVPDMLERYQKPFILCEYAHAMGNSVGGLHKYTELLERYERYQGGFIWDYVDQALLTTAPNGKPRLAYGGDFGDRPTDRDFCGNGLVFADRTPTPRMQEVKYLYQPVRITPDDSGVTLENRHLFTNASRYELRFELRLDGQTVQRGRLEDLDVAPGAKRRYALPLAPLEADGEYVLHCGLCLRQPTAWAEAGYELMHGECVVRRGAAKTWLPERDYVISTGRVSTGARSATFEALFSRDEGGMSSLRDKTGRELLCTPPALSLYRAPTNNDMGNQDFRAECFWHTASLFSRPTLLSAQEENGLLVARFRYALPLERAESIDVTYTVLGKGRVRVDMEWAGAEGLPDMEAFGLSLRLPRELRNVRYYGLGPDENYSDRLSGAQLGLFAYDVDANLTPYLQPQECGNRGGVRYLTVTDASGCGVRVDMVDSPLEISVLPHSAQELMAARHLDELGDPCYTYLDVALKRKGVGGEDSWGAPVHPEYHIPSDQALRLSFVLSV
ncbi:MAG TPA: DUF4981 domain-containing protein [Candidatus Limiplasma stercoravium]|nr:DUF4981 domain-containing protein [Candidatus Limiplasma stercoravium]